MSEKRINPSAQNPDRALSAVCTEGKGREFSTKAVKCTEAEFMRIPK